MGVVSAATAGGAGAAGDGPGGSDGGGAPRGIAGCGGAAWGADWGVVSAATAGEVGAAGDGPAGNDGGEAPGSVAGCGGALGGASGDGPGGGALALPATAGVSSAGTKAVSAGMGIPVYRPCLGAGIGTPSYLYFLTTLSVRQSSSAHTCTRISSPLHLAHPEMPCVRTAGCVKPFTPGLLAQQTVNKIPSRPRSTKRPG